MILLALTGLIVAHEAGHALCARVLGYPVRLGWRSVGWGSDDVTSPHRHRALVAAGGLGANLALADWAILTGHGVFAFANLVFVAVNLCSDGRHILL